MDAGVVLLKKALQDTQDHRVPVAPRTSLQQPFHLLVGSVNGSEQPHAQESAGDHPAVSGRRISHVDDGLCYLGVSSPGHY